jgi:hypothetical protein
MRPMPHHQASSSSLGLGSFFDSTAWHLFQNLSLAELMIGG